MHRQAEAFFARYGLTANQFTVLAVLSEQDRVPQRDVAERAGSDQNTIRPVLLALERKGLVIREQHPNDGRAWMIHLSGKGRRLFQKVHSEGEGARAPLISALRSSEPEQLVDMLDRITLAIQNGATQAAGELR